jgi:cytochrome c oxidase subunit 2
MDLIPGHENKLGFTADIPGTYFGECAEFCGESHAFMRFKVLAVPQADFDAWVAAWNTPPASDATPSAGDVAEAPASFGICLTCHRINGTNASVAEVGIEAPDEMGPNLTLFGCRTTIAAGLLENTEENLREWLHNPAGIKQGNFMGDVVREGALDSTELDELVKYLTGLKPQGGCPPVSRENLNE